VKLTVVGCSPAWPNPGISHSGYLVEGEGRLLLDCGPGVLADLRQRDGGWPKVDAIAITHWHLDHFGDLIPWVWGHLFGLGLEDEMPELWVPPAGRAQLTDFGRQFGTPDMFERVFTIREYAEGEPCSAAGFEVSPFKVLHYLIETYAFRVTDGSRVITYSGDSAPCDNLVEAARDADLFLCEATLADSDSDAKPRGHLSVPETVGTFEASGAKRLLITHRPQELPLGGDWEQATPGLEIEI
jgi:ribonuclease BN (tRNA processing enzyme)